MSKVTDPMLVCTLCTTCRHAIPFVADFQKQKTVSDHYIACTWWRSDLLPQWMVQRMKPHYTTGELMRKFQANTYEPFKCNAYEQRITDDENSHD